jgi:hypothetical protein
MPKVLGIARRIAKKKASSKEALSISPPTEPVTENYPEISNSAIDQIMEKLSEPCEIIANVKFWGTKETSLVALTTKSELNFLRASASEFKVMSQTELLKKGVTEVPIWCWGSNTREKLAKEPKLKLHEEDKKTLQEAKRLRKKMLEEEQTEASEEASVNIQSEE